MSLTDYLAKNYLSEDKKAKKKKKEKEKLNKQDISEKLLIVKDDISGWDSSLDKAASTPIDSEEGTAPEPVKKTSRGWKKIGSNTIKIKQEQVKEEYSDEENRLSSGIRAGLQSASQVQEDIERRRLKEKKEMESLEPTVSDTIYRDATGRIIDVQTKKNEIQKADQEKIEKELRIKELNQGLVQREKARINKDRLDSMRNSSLHIREDDSRMNEDLKTQERFNDPATKFLKRQFSSRHHHSRHESYHGSYGPNRFSIPPGLQWDGVDRSNGFERRWFQKQNERKEQVALNYQMALDD